MGTHPIFESDFDCLTDACRIFAMKLFALISAAMSAPALQFEHKVAQKAPSTEQKVIEKPFGKDIVEDYESKDGNYKYHAEMHYLTNSNKDGFGGMETSKLVQNSFGSIADLDQELNKMMENAFNIDSFFGKMVPNFGKNIISRFNPEENEVIEQIEGSGDSKPLFFF